MSWSNYTRGWYWQELFLLVNNFHRRGLDQVIETPNNHLQLICGQGFNNLCPTYILPTSLHLFMHLMASLTLSNCLYFHTVCACVEYVWIFLSVCLHACTQTALMSAEPAINVCCTIFFLFVITCVLVLELGAKNEYVLGSRVLAYLGLPRLPNWIVPSDMADLHNLVVSFTASHGPGDEWQPQKIIFLLGCNKSCVKCSTAYIAMAKKW